MSNVSIGTQTTPRIQHGAKGTRQLVLIKGTDADDSIAQFAHGVQANRGERDNAACLTRLLSICKTGGLVRDEAKFNESYLSTKLATMAAKKNKEGQFVYPDLPTFGGVVATSLDAAKIAAAQAEANKPW